MYPKWPDTSKVQNSGKGMVLPRKTFMIGQAVLMLALGACVGRETPPTPIAEPVLPTVTPMQLPLPYSGALELAEAPDPPRSGDLESPFALPSAGFTPLAFVANRSFVELAEVDVFEMGERLYAVQRQNALHKQSPGGYVLMDVTDPAQPVYLGAWNLSPPTSGEHISVFRQEDRWYILLPLEAGRFQACGLAIIEITDPTAPILQGLHNGVTAGADTNWCSVHSVEIITDEQGTAEYLLAGTPDTFDVRVLDIRDLDNIREINVYHLHAHPHGTQAAWAHQMKAVGDRVYVSHQAGGVMILDKAALLSGADPEEVELTPPESIAAPDFRVHDAYPTANGDFLFVNDAFRSLGGLRLFDIRELAQARPVLTVDFEELKGQRHTLLVEDDLLFVPWFQKGVQVFRYDVSQPERPVLELVAFQEVRSLPINVVDGVVGIRLHPCNVGGEIRTCVFASDSSLGLLILALDNS